MKVLFQPGDTARFAREARVLASLQHPGIVRYIDHGTLDSRSPAA